MKINKMIRASLLGLCLSLSYPCIAHASSSDTASNLIGKSEKSSLMFELVNKTPGTNYSDMKRAIEEEALANGVTENQVIREILSEIDSEFQENQIQARSSSKPKANKPIGLARNRGDVFYSPASTAGVSHGHSGIYSEKTKIVEATPGHGVKERTYSQVRVSSGAQKQYVNTSQANRNKAANQARKFIGRSYNYKFPINKTSKGPMNCSQTVWAAYKTATGIDLDSNGGHGVYPVDILRSKYTVTYQRF